MSGDSCPGRLRVLVVDDSAYTRRSITEILSASPDIEVVGKAADGDEALRLIKVYHPDVITLDLEMPRMDGFTFLRILMSSHPLPVIVVSSYGQRDNVFRALELGAMDFVVKPDRYADAELSGIQRELLEKVLLARRVRRVANRQVREIAPASAHKIAAGGTTPRRIIAIASSTGGPTALLETLVQLPEHYPHAIVIAQHMPEKFTATFAERLDKRTKLSVSEARDEQVLCAGMAVVCPGRRCLEVQDVGGLLSLKLMRPHPDDRYVPSGDRLLSSVARAAGSRSVGLILTGMGDDGAKGALAIHQAGGYVVAENEQTAVVYGMPGAAVRNGAVDRSLPLPAIGAWLAELVG